MIKKILSINIILVLIFTTLVSVKAMAPTPRIDLNDYEITSTNKDNIYVSGTVNIAKGQNIALFDSTGKIPLNYLVVKNSNNAESFKLQVPSRVLKSGKNTFKVISLPIRGVLNSSNPKTVTVTIKDNSKKAQKITANNISLKVGEKKKLNAKVSSNLPLTYSSSNTSIALVDAKGTVIGKKVGTAKITIKQSGNSQYTAASKTITVKVTAATPEYNITYNANGGKGSINKKKAKSGSKIVIAKNKFKRNGYTFTGWATSKKGKVKYEEGKIIKLTKNMTLYAVWEKDVISSKKSITNIALNLAYPLGTSKKKASYKRGKPTEQYKKALHKYYNGYHFWSNASRKGASCDVFVGTVVRASGYDSKFPAGLGKQIRYMNSSSKWIKVKWDGKKSSLKSGDILYSKHNRTNRLNNGHIYIYVVKNGKGYIANASAGGFYGKVQKYSDRRKLKKVRYVKVFRAKKASIR